MSINAPTVIATNFDKMYGSKYIKTPLGTAEAQVKG
jgi:hypothetical protein